MSLNVLSNDVQRQDDELVEKAVTILVRELGSVAAGRFLAMPPRQRMESVKRHQTWQQELHQERFFNEVFGDR